MEFYRIIKNYFCQISSIYRKWKFKNGTIWIWAWCKWKLAAFGHTSTAFTIATVLSEQIDNTYASIALYSLASLTAYQRVYADAHWFSDTFLGAVLGTFIGLKITSLHEKHREINRSLRLGIYPQLNSGGYKLGLFIQFWFSHILKYFISYFKFINLITIDLYQ